MSEKKSSSIIPTLLAGAAVYFGLNQKGSDLGDLAKEAVSRVVDDQAGVTKKHRRSQRRRAGSSNPKNSKQDIRAKNHTQQHRT